MTSAGLKVAIWGIGGHARRRLIPAIASASAITLVGVHTRNHEIGQAVAAASACRYYRSPDEMLADPEVEAVLLAGPTGLHHAHGVTVLQAGRHLIAEKPMTHSLATTRDLLAIAERVERRVFAALMYKYHAQFEAVGRIVGAGQLGQVRAMTVNFGLPPLRTNTFRDDPGLGGGALLDLACYGLSLVWQLSATPPQFVAGEVLRRGDHVVDTEGWCVLRANGARAMIQWGMGRSYQNRAEIWGSRGRLLCERIFTKEADHMAELALIDERGAEAQRWQVEPQNAYARMLQEIAHRLDDDAFAAAENAEAEWSAEMLDRLRDNSLDD